MEVEVIGSLLLSKLEVNYPFQTKAKALYVVEYLAKKDKDFEFYFKHHSQKIRDFPQPEDNVENYKKVQRTVLNQLGAQVGKVTEVPEKQLFVDPGYHQEPSKSSISSFLELAASKQKKSEGKKPIIGPGQLKSKSKKKEEEGDQNLLQLNSEPVKKTI